MPISRYALILAVLLPGCAILQRDAISDRENTLAAAGFTVRPIDTAARSTMITRLPPDRISQRIDGANVSYLYPDPVKCHCLYVGNQAAYARYQQISIQRNIARDQIDAAQLNSENDWDWGPWGGYGPGFGAGFE